MIDDRRLGGSGEPEMSPLFMDTGFEASSPGSPSAEECPSNTPVPEERESGRQQVGGRGSKRRDKNRDAARKSRKKQTERADELHEELQQLERSNAAFQKEIAALRKQLHEYETALKRHKPHCRLGASSADQQSSSSPPKVPAKVSNSPLAAAASSLSTSLTSSLGLTTTSASCAGTSADPVTVPYSASFLAHSPPHSLFSDAAQITPRPTNVVPGLLANSPARNIRGTSAAPFTGDALLAKQTPFLTASPSVAPPYPRLPQLRPRQFSPNRSSPPAAARSLSVPPQASLQPSPAPPFGVNPSYNSPPPASLLSLLTIPSPLNVFQTKSSGTDGALSQPPPPDLGPDLSELLENNDWILSGPPSTTE